MTDALLKIENLKTWLGDEQSPVRAVDGIDLEIREGETFALLGESGCGKSMTALSIMRLLPPAGRIVDGRVLLDGTNLLELPEIAMRKERGGRMGMIFQEPMTSLNPVMTVGEQIAEAVRIHDPQHAAKPNGRVVELLQSVGIPDPEQRRLEYPHQLAQGAAAGDRHGHPAYHPRPGCGVRGSRSGGGDVCGRDCGGGQLPAVFRYPTSPLQPQAVPIPAGAG